MVVEFVAALMSLFSIFYEQSYILGGFIGLSVVILYVYGCGTVAVRVWGGPACQSSATRHRNLIITENSYVPRRCVCSPGDMAENGVLGCVICHYDCGLVVGGSGVMEKS